MQPLLPEDLYPIELPPVIAQANNECKVLFYSTSYGWYAAAWSSPFMDNTTHWTLLPDRPVVKLTPTEKCDIAFDLWCAREKTSPISKEFLYPAFVQGWESRVKNAYN